MSDLDRLTREQLVEVLGGLSGRLAGRIAMNLRTAELHPEFDVKREAGVRAQAYDLALGDLELCVAQAQEKK